MKFRSDFVTNSSSSNFTVMVTVIDKENNYNHFELDPYEINCDEGGTAYFSADLRKALEMHNLLELCEFLTENAQTEYDDDAEIEYGPFDDEDYGDEEDETDCCDEEYDEEYNGFGGANFKARKEAFARAVMENVGTIENVKSIIVERGYSAWGEYADLIADNDEPLVDFAHQLVNAAEEDKHEIRVKMLEYINTPDTEGYRTGESFAVGINKVGYNWYGEEKDLDRLAQRLTSFYGPGSVEGYECFALDMETGEYDEYAEFELN